MKHTVLKRSLLAAFTASTVLPALAQEAMQVVEVTAQSRRQSVKDVPLTLQVVGQKDIQALGAKDLAAMNGYIPGLVVDAIEPTQPSFGIRGVHPGDFGIATDSPVGIYVDGVYTGKTGGALMNFVDIQRIEVVKGPQGTLFGRNSAAGAIAIITNTPGAETEMEGRVKFGSHGRREGEVLFNLPVNSISGVRFVAVRSASDGWVTNTTTGKKAGGDDDWATRLSYRLKAGSATIDLSWEHEKMFQDGRPAFAVIKNPALPLMGYRGVYDAAYTANFVDPFKAPLENDNPGREYRNFDGSTLRFEMPLGSGVQLSATTAFRKYDTRNYTDNDGSARKDISLNTLDAKNARSYQQEFKLSSRQGSMDWIAGVSFYENKEHQDSGADTTTATLDTLSLFSGGQANFAMLFGGLGASGMVNVNAKTWFPWAELNQSDVNTKAQSLYGDVIWHMDDKTNLTVGARYSRDRKSMTWFFPERSTPELDNFLKTWGPLAGISPASFPSNVIFDVAHALASKPVSREKTWTDFSPRLVVDHKLDKDTMLFASLSRGYQAGGFNIFTPPNPASSRDPSFDPEKMTNLELGAKLSFPAYRASLNAALFSYKFKNLQDISLYAVGTIPTYNVVSSDQKATGLDVDGRIRIADGWTAFGGFEYIDQTYSRYQRLDGSGKVSLDLSGEPVGTPRFTGMGGISGSWALANGQASMSLQGTYTGATRCHKESAALGCLRSAAFNTGEATSKFDLRLGWEAASHRYGVALLVNNLLDKRHVGSVGGQTKEYGFPYAYLSQGRTVAIELRGSL